MVRALRFLEKVFNCGKIYKKRKNRPKTPKKAHSSPRATIETTNSRNAEIGTNVARGLRMMPEPIVFR